MKIIFGCLILFVHVFAWTCANHVVREIVRSSSVRSLHWDAGQRHELVLCMMALLAGVALSVLGLVVSLCLRRGWFALADSIFAASGSVTASVFYWWTKDRPTLYERDSLSSGNLGTGLTVLSVGLVFYVVGLGVQWMLRRRQQRVRDDEASRAVRASSNDSIVLYLRPIPTDYRLETNAGVASTLMQAFHPVLPAYPRYERFDGQLYGVCSRREWVCLGVFRPWEVARRRGVDPIVGRVAVSLDAWKREVLALAERAKAIVVIPGVGDGIRWEVRLVIKRYLEKAVFVMPPRSIMRNREGWVFVREKAKVRGIEMPQDNLDGFVVRFGSEGRVASVSPYAASDCDLDDIIASAAGGGDGVALGRFCPNCVLMFSRVNPRCPCCMGLLRQNINGRKWCQKCMELYVEKEFVCNNRNCAELLQEVPDA